MILRPLYQIKIILKLWVESTFDSSYSRVTVARNNRNTFNELPITFSQKVYLSSNLEKFALSIITDCFCFTLKLVLRDISIIGTQLINFIYLTLYISFEGNSLKRDLFLKARVVKYDCIDMPCNLHALNVHCLQVAKWLTQKSNRGKFQRIGSEKIKDCHRSYGIPMK